ncbi:MAG: hypothetical protein ACI8TX_000537 [Hyphomicrobiaceae bacterium]|jgi:hypothetical protein
MTRPNYTLFDPLLTQAQADSMVALCERFGSYGMYSEEPTFPGLPGEGLPARWDAARNFINTGGRFARSEEIETLAARTNYFRETYAYGSDVRAPGIEPFLNHQGMVEAARNLFDREVVEPAIVFANLLVPGQELAIHTDVPEFRGVGRKTHPQWLIVAMHHSGLFDEWRMPIATCVSWFHNSEGGEFAFYPDGPKADPQAINVRFNTAVITDTDSVFHGVDRVGRQGVPVAPLKPGMKLSCDGDQTWVVREGLDEIARYKWQDLRFSISWKAYCFADEAERTAWAEHHDDLKVEDVISRMLEDLRARGIVGDQPPEGQELVDLLIDAYIQFPEPVLAEA